MENLSLDFKVQNIEPPDDESDDLRGVVDVRFWLRGESWSDLRGFTDVRVYFTDASMSIDQIKAEAPLVAKRVLMRLAELGKSDHLPAGLEQRWK